jgi:hypothetical protein
MIKTHVTNKTEVLSELLHLGPKLSHRNLTSFRKNTSLTKSSGYKSLDALHKIPSILGSKLLSCQMKKGKQQLRTIPAPAVLSDQFFFLRYNNLIALNHHWTNITSLTRVTTAYKCTQNGKFIAHWSKFYKHHPVTMLLDFISRKARMAPHCSICLQGIC